MSRELWEIVRADDLKVGDVAMWGSPDEYEEFKIMSIKPVVDEDGEDMEEIEFGIGPSMSTDLGKGERVFRRIPDAEDPRVLRRALEIAATWFANRYAYADPDAEAMHAIELARKELESEDASDQAK